MARAGRALGVALLATGALALLVAGVVVALDRLVPQRINNSCTAELADGSVVRLAPDQAQNAALISAIALRRGLPARAVTIGLATALQESKLRNIDYGDRDSLGLFQQRPSQGWGTPEEITDPVYSTNAFYDVLVTISGYTELPITEAAQRVQRSAFPDAYAQHENRSRAFASGLTGHSPASIVCRLPMPPAPVQAAAVARARERLAADLGELPTSVVADGSMAIEAAALATDGDAVRAGWAAAHWAVATADATGISEVRVAGQAWRRQDGNDAGWKPEPDGPPTGVVHLR